MPLAWHRMDLDDKAEAIIDMIPGLTDQDIQNTYDEWSRLRYEKGSRGRTEALADFQSIATKHLLKRQDKWDGYMARVKDNVAALKR